MRFWLTMAAAVAVASTAAAAPPTETAPSSAADAGQYRLEDYESWAAMQPPGSATPGDFSYFTSRSGNYRSQPGVAGMGGGGWAPMGGIDYAGSHPACTNCNSCYCVNCCPGGYIYFDAEILGLRPHFENSTALVQELNPVLPPNVATTSREFDYGYDPAYRLSVGAVHGCGVGFRAAYWEFDHEEGNTPRSDVGLVGATPAFPLNNAGFAGFGPLRLTINALGDVIEAEHHMHLRAADMEGTSEFTLCNNRLRFSGGVRYVEMEQRYQATNIDGAARLDTFVFDHDFHGLGPMLGLAMARQLGRSGIELYVNGRSALLVGSANQQLANIRSVNVIPFNVQINDDSSQIFVTELAFGVKYDHGPMFVRGGWESQIWEGAGGPTDASGDLSLHGWTFAVGLSR